MMFLGSHVSLNNTPAALQSKNFSTPCACKSPDFTKADEAQRASVNNNNTPHFFAILHDYFIQEVEKLTEKNN